MNASCSSVRPHSQDFGPRRKSLWLWAGMVGVWLALLSAPLHAQENAPPKPPTLDPTYGLPLPGRAAQTARRGPEAQWIWAAQTADNQTVFLRADLTLARTPKTAPFYVTADDFFTLYVNGQQVAETKPDPKDDLVWSHVHHLDIAHYLVAGKNAVALRALNAGGPAGALARLEIDDKPVLLTGANWKVSATTPPDNWTSAAYDDSDWKPATVIAPLDGGPWSDQLQGWPGYEAAVAPYLAHLTLPVAAVVDVHNGAGRLVGAETVMRPEATNLAIGLPDSGSHDPPSMVLDFGKEVAGRIEIQAHDAITVLVGTGESQEEAVKSPWGGVHRLDIVDGQKAFTPYSAFRYAKLTFLAFPGQTVASIANASSLKGFPQITGVTLDHLYYPVQYKGSFSCSDDLLTRIWYTGAYTAHLCMQSDIWDAPKRDRARWMGDLHVSGEVINTAFADTFLMEQTMQRLRDDAQGGQSPSASPKAHVNSIPGYSCAWIAGLADFHRHIGDYTYLNKQHDLLISMLDFLRGELDDQGLFANKRGEWPFVDWSPDFDGNTPLARAATHCFLVKAVREAVFLLDEMNDPANAAKYAAWADALTAAAQKSLIVSSTHTFSDRRQENAMAIYSGVATAPQTQTIYDAILKPGSPAWDKIATPYYNYYVINAMSLAGHTPEALQFVRDYWGGMLAEGATSFWEGYDPRWEKTDFHGHLQADDGTGYFVSLCHGWSAGPTAWLTEWVLGVRPTAGGFNRADIVPNLADLSWAEGDVPTPNGLLHLRAEKQAGGMLLHLSLPKGVNALVGVPGKTVTVNGHAAEPEKVDGGRAYVRLDSSGKYTLVSQ